MVEEEVWPKVVVPDPLNNLTPEKEEELKRGIKSGMTEKKWSFNPAKGELKTYESKEEFDEDMKMGIYVATDRPPKSNCKFCFGRGYIGRDVRFNGFIPCGCMFDTKKGKKNVR